MAAICAKIILINLFQSFYYFYDVLHHWNNWNNWILLPSTGVFVAILQLLWNNFFFSCCKSLANIAELNMKNAYSFVNIQFSKYFLASPKLLKLFSNGANNIGKIIKNSVDFMNICIYTKCFYAFMMIFICWWLEHFWNFLRKMAKML